MTIVDTVTVPADVTAFALPERLVGRTTGLGGTRCAVGASASVIQRKNGVKSATLTMYQVLSAESQRAPKAFAASFSANGVIRLILMRAIIERRAASLTVIEGA